MQFVWNRKWRKEKIRDKDKVGKVEQGIPEAGKFTNNQGKSKKIRQFVRKKGKGE